MTKKMMVLITAGVMAAFIAIAGCSTNNNAATTSGTQSAPEAKTATPKEVRLNVLYAGGDPSHSQGVSEAIAAFAKEYPHIKIAESSSGSAPYTEFIKTKDAVGEFPDLLEMFDTQLYADAGKLAELPADIADLFETVPEINGKKYAAPIYNNFPLGIIYNKKMFADAGIADEPKTYAEFREIAETIKAAGISPLVVGGKDIWHMGFLINKFLIDEMYIGNPNWNSERTAGKVSWTDPGPTQAMKNFTELFTNGYVDEGFLSTADNQTTSVLVSGKAAMLYSGPWMFQQILGADPDFQLGWFPLPDEDGQVNLIASPIPQGWVISAEAARDPDKLEAIKTFIKFFFAKEQYTNYLTLMSAIPTTKEKMTYDAIEPMQELIAVLNDEKTGKSMYINDFWGENQIPPQFRNWFYKLSQEWVVGHLTLEEAMKQADAEWDAEVAAMNK